MKSNKILNFSNTRILKNNSNKINSFTNIRDQHFIQPTLKTFSTFFKIFKYTSYFSLALLVTSLTSYELFNQYIENFKLTTPSTYSHIPNDDKDEWSVDNDDWSGGLNGGTNKEFPTKANHLIRSTYIALNYGVGNINANVNNPNLTYAKNYLIKALNLIENDDRINDKSSKLIPLNLLLADIYQRLNTTTSLNESLNIYESVYNDLRDTKFVNKAALMKLSNKAGNVCKSLKLFNQSERWFKNSINFVINNDTIDKNTDNTWLNYFFKTKSSSIYSLNKVNVNQLSPSQFRYYISTLLNLSELHSLNKNYKEAIKIQNYLISTLNNSTQPVSSLHSCWILNSLALTKIHLAEVKYVNDKSNVDECLGWLQSSQFNSQNAIEELKSLDVDKYQNYQSIIINLKSKNALIEASYLMGLLHEFNYNHSLSNTCFKRCLTTLLDKDEISKDDINELNKTNLNRKYTEHYINSLKYL